MNIKVVAGNVSEAEARRRADDPSWGPVTWECPECAASVVVPTMRDAYELCASHRCES